MARRKAFQDTSKWIIFKHPQTKMWTVTPPNGWDLNKYEKSFDKWETACWYHYSLGIKHE